MPYEPEKDVILWSSEKIEYTPTSTIQAQIKQYNGGIPKLLIVQEGKGHRGKEFSGYLVKRLELDRLDLFMDLLKEGRDELTKYSQTPKLKEV